MDEIEEDIFSILNSFLSTDNKIRSEAEDFYSKLENTNPDKMVNCLLSIINSNKKSYESLLALIKLGRFIEDSALNLDCGISLPCLKKLRENYLSLLSDKFCPTVTRNYILSVIENYIFISNGTENEWPELIPFFLSLLKDENHPQDQSEPTSETTKSDKIKEITNTSGDVNNGNANNQTSTNEIDKNDFYLRSISISFFTYFLIVRPTDDFDSLIRPYLNLNSPDEFERSSSLKFILISMYNKIGSNMGNYYNYKMGKSGSDSEKTFIQQLPHIFASLRGEYFYSNFAIFWKIFKKNHKIFSDNLSDIIGLLITNTSNPSHDELFRRDSLFFFHRLFNFSKKCRKLINSDLTEIVIKIISSVLQNPHKMPDLYEEARETINDILENSCKKAYDENIDDKSDQYVSNALEIAQRYAEGSNLYVSSFYISFFRGDMFIEKVFQNASSNDRFIRENGFLCLKKRIENEKRKDIGTFLFSKIQSHALNSSESDFNDRHNELKEYVDLFCLWCQKSDKYDVEPFIKKILDLISVHDSYLLLSCASFACCKCHESAKYVLKKLMTKLMKNFSIKEKDLIEEDFIDSFKLSIISNSYQCVDQTVAIESFQKVLSLCLNSSSSLNIINSTPFLEIMEVIGYKFAPFLNEIIPHLFSLVRKSAHNILPVIDCFEKIVSLFNSSNSFDSFLDSILDFAISYGSKFNDNDDGKIDENKEILNTQMDKTDIQQIRLESIILLNLLLQNNWSNETLYGKCLQFVMVEIPSEVSENCLDALFSIVILFIEHEDENNINKKSDKISVVEMTKYDVLNYFLSYIPFAISKAIENNSETLFASAASIFVLLLKRIPNETTQLFFQVQKLIPHYSIYSPPVTPPSSFSSPFSRNPTITNTPDFTNNYDNSNNSNELRCFSLMIWTDFVTFGPDEQTCQYQKSVVDDLKFYAEKTNPLKNKNEEHFRKIAIICLYSYYTAFTSVDSHMKKSDLEIETVLDKFYRIASNVNSNSIEIIEASTAAFAIVFQKYVNEKIFILRTKQLMNLLHSIQRQTDESDTIYNEIFQLALMCLKNIELYDFFDQLIDALSNAIKRHLLSDTALDDITQCIIELGEKAPKKLQLIIQV